MVDGLYSIFSAIFLMVVASNPFNRNNSLAVAKIDCLASNLSRILLSDTPIIKHCFILEHCLVKKGLMPILEKCNHFINTQSLGLKQG